jgi:hypothetical protein
MHANMSKVKKSSIKTNTSKTFLNHTFLKVRADLNFRERKNQSMKCIKKNKKKI